MHIRKRYRHIHKFSESDKKGFICLFFLMQNSFYPITGLWFLVCAPDVAKLVPVVQVLVLCPV